MGEFFRKVLIATLLGLIFGVCATAGAVVVARHTGLWELWEKGGNEQVSSYSASMPSSSYDAQSGRGGLLRNTLPEEEEEAPAGKEEAVRPESAEEPEKEEAGDLTEKDAAAPAEAAPTYVSVNSEVSAVAKKVMPAVAAITNHYVETASFWGRLYRQEAESSGSGFIVAQGAEGILLATNYHVVEEATRLTVVFADGETAEAQIVGTARSMDLAVIAVPYSLISEETLSRIAVATLGDSDALSVGEPAIAIGNALGYGQSVTVGVISALNRPIQGYENEEVGGQVGLFIQTDAAINPGNSGGALLNIKGEVIGINSNKIGGESVEGMGYAIPISAARPIIEELISGSGERQVRGKDQGFLGITGATVSEEEPQFYGMPAGVYITGIITNSGADFAGLREGDIIVSFGGKMVTTLEGLKRVLTEYPIGSSAVVEYMRLTEEGYRMEQTEVTLGERPS